MTPQRKNLCISLSQEEYNDFQRVKIATGHGATAIFKAMVKSLNNNLPKNEKTEEDL